VGFSPLWAANAAVLKRVIHLPLRGMANIDTPRGRIACIGNVEAKQRRGRARKCATSGSLSWGFRQWYKLWLNVRVRKLFHIERQPCPIEQQRAAAYRPVALRRTVVSGRRVLYLPVELRARELMGRGFLRRARLERGNRVGN
jgi:hypothetical protein